MTLTDAPLAERRVLSALRAVLPSGATVRVRRSRGRAVELQVNGHPLRAYWLGEGQAWRVRQALQLAGPRRPDVLVARAMLPGAQAAATEAGVGWVDEAGGAELVLDWIVLSRTQNPESKPARREPGWTPAIAGVAEALLLGRQPTVDGIEAATGLSRGLVARALSFFSHQGFLAASVARGPTSARRLVDADGLRQAYVEATRTFSAPELRVGVLWRDPLHGVTDLGRTWAEAGQHWAATGTLAAAVLAPLLTDVGTAEVFIEGQTFADLVVAAERVRTRPMEGGRLLLRPFPSTATARLSEQREGLWVAPWPRVYADLLASGGVRGEDAAEHLREVMQSAAG
jgi:hypothetical protein